MRKTVFDDYTTLIRTAKTALRRALAVGAKKYPPGHWATIDIDDHLKAALRHTFLVSDQVTHKEDHLAHAICRLVMAMNLREKNDG